MLKKTHPNSFFILFETTSPIADKLFGSNCKYANKKAKILQIELYDNAFSDAIAEVIFEKDYNVQTNSENSFEKK